MLVHSTDPLNAESPRAALAEGPRTATDAFYVRGHGPVPDVRPSAVSVEVGGLVERELELTLEDLRERFPSHEVEATLQCAGNRRSGLIDVRDIPGEEPWGPGATGTAVWRGVSLAGVLEAAGVRDGAAHVGFEGVDEVEEAEPTQRYGDSVSLAKAMAPEVLLAWEMNGEPLPRVHGGPLRVVVPGYIGARSVKWVRRIELRAEPWEGFFQSTAYRLLPADGEMARRAGVALGEVALNADVLVPDDDATVEAGDLEVRGYAFAGGARHVIRVDVSTDGGATWCQAELLEDQGPWAWRQWRAHLRFAPGRHEIVVRAWDSAAATQPESPASVWNPKGYVNNAWGRITITAA